MALKFGTLSLQLVLFYPALDLKDKITLTQALRSLKSINFNGEPTVLPLPNDVPAEIPRIILRSKDQKYEMNVALNRTDILYINKDEDDEGLPTQKIAEIKDTLIKASQEVHDILIKGYSGSINRSAVITQQVIKLDSGSKTFLESKLLKPTETQPFEIKLAYLYKETLKDSYFDINKWVRVDTLRNIKKPQDDSALRLTHDINTLSEKNYDFNDGKLSSFFEKATDLVENEVADFVKAE